MMADAEHRAITPLVRVGRALIMRMAPDRVLPVVPAEMGEG